MTTRTTLRTLIGGTVAATALVVMTIGGTAQAADGGGLRNCVDVTGKQIGQVGCYEKVWAGGVEYRMTFSNVKFSGNTPKELDRFYVLAPQTDTPQGPPPAPFSHDHVVRDLPAQNHGSYSVKLQGYFVLCSGQGIGSGACVPTWTAPGGPDVLPFATTVNGHPLTST
ncbi:MAG TPA: hypothetical protein VFY18_01420, partial [Candidatus Limnocylindrales bacterium]|nr:hypothetical protein [Candidatus Limnocylindrales bacterium]